MRSIPNGEEGGDRGLNEEASSAWQRALTALESARLLLPSDPDGCASRAYYAAFYAVSALFALEGKWFSKHTGLEAAVHRDLVKLGIWPRELGTDYSTLVGLRATGDYGSVVHVSFEDGRHAIQSAERVVRAVQALHPDVFSCV